MIASHEAPFPTLFSPLSLRSLTVPNRVVMLPMGSRFGKDGKPTEEGIAFYEARARGGVGLVITGGTLVQPSSALWDRRMFEAFDPSTVPALSRLAAGVHRHGARIFGQIMHRGRFAPDESEWRSRAPSPIPSGGVMPHEMTVAELDELVEAFAASAANLRSADYDGIEIHAGHGYLLAEFLSPLANRRRDSYGGTTLARTRLLVRVIDAVRDRIGNGPPLGVRISAEEEVEGGLHVAESREIVRALEGTGKVDYISVAVGVTGGYVKDMSAPVGCAVDVAAAIKQATHLAVIASQRITQPSLAERILSSGAADLVGMARALVADAEWSVKARSGRHREIRPCVGCLQVCRSQLIGCMQNPESGRELVWPPGSASRSVASPARHVVIVGGGPAGLEAAMVAAARGHRVTLYDEHSTLGGQVALAAKAPTRSELHAVVSYRQGELERLGVNVRLGMRVTADGIIRETPDAVIVATGALPRRPSFVGAELPHVISVWQLFEEIPAVDALLTRARSAVVIDDGSGSWEVCSAAECLAERGLQVEFVTPALFVGVGVRKESLGRLLRRLRSRGVRFHVQKTVVAVRPATVTVRDAIRFEADKTIEDEELAADIVVAYDGKEVDRTLLLELEGRVPEVHSAGDCVSPGRIEQAVLDGYRIGRAI